MRRPAHRGEGLWCITTYFNPVGYANKRDHLLRFSECVRMQGLRLLIVELALGESPHQLEAVLADRLVQIRSRTVLWHKERLLNIALEHLPDTCDKVAWIDADILFENDEWVREADVLLDEYMVVQLYESAWLLPPDCVSGPLTRELQAQAVRHSGAVSAYEAGQPAMCGHPGLAWAAQKRVLQRHGLYDRAILGSGDLILTLAILGYFEREEIRESLTSWCSEHLFKDALIWAQRLFADVKGRVSFVRGSVLHLWHGHVEDRHYLSRHLILKQANFNPCTDISLDENTCWQWSSHKPELHRRVAEYFYSRREEAGALPRACSPT